MGRIRLRQPAEVRAKALETAVAKFDEGCTTCAASYLSLAQQHGATLEQVAQAGIGRRGFLKLAATVLAAGTAVAAADLILPRTARAFAPTPMYPDTGFYGVDSCTSLAHATAASMPLQFYIAEIGAGAHGLGCLNPMTAAHVGPDYTHGYWGLCGPLSAPADAYAYGQQQAVQALQAVGQLPTVGGHTLFADVEAGFGGWGGRATPAQNAALLDGFLETIAGAQYIPGVYISHYDRDTWFPASYAPNVPFVYWVAGGLQAGTMCAPCDPSCDTLTPTRELWSNAVQHETFGGQQVVLWQYWLSDFGCSGDFNFSYQSGYQTFTPVVALPAA